MFLKTQESPAWALFMGFEHERIHLETSSVLMRELPLRLLRRPRQWPAYHPSTTAGGGSDAIATNGGGGDIAMATNGGGNVETSSSSSPEEGLSLPANELLRVPAGPATLGKPLQWPSHGWDNEYGCRRFQVAPFSASSRLVSNAEMLAFVRAGGYRTERWWGADGWRWRTFRNAKWPSFWQPNGPAGEGVLHVMGGRVNGSVRNSMWDCEQRVLEDEKKKTF